MNFMKNLNSKLSEEEKLKTIFYLDNVNIHHVEEIKEYAAEKKLIHFFPRLLLY
jgi:hypothetical protein